ncbi:MAG: ABC transporter permease [Chthoniobacterales bacterium]
MQNLRHSLRSLLKQPLFSGIVVLTFALGIGANSAVFSVVNTVMWRPLPFPQPQNLTMLLLYDMRSRAIELNEDQTCSYPDFADWRSQNLVFEQMAVYTNNGVTTLTDGGEATHVQGEAVSANLFSLLRVQPILGRGFLSKEDEPGNRVVILSHALWQGRFGGDPKIIGRLLTFNGEKFEVVGVMPEQFEFPIGKFSPEVWTTMSMLRETQDGASPMTEQRGNDFLKCVARLKPHVSLDQAQANIDTISAALRQQYPDSNTNVGVKVVPLARAMVGDAHTALLMLCAMAGCVLLVACVNVVNLLLARSVSRQKEISIRTALGAGRWHIIKQLLFESLLLSVAGGVIGFMIATWALDSLKTFLPAHIPRIAEVSPDFRVLVFTAAVSLGAALLAGLLPAWRASHPNITGTLNENARGSTEGVHNGRTRSVLVVVEIVLALVLLASAGLLVQSFLRLQKVHPGFDPANVITARVALPNSRYAKPEQAAQFFKKLFANISASPGINSAAGAWWIPLSGSEIVFTFNLEERPLPKAQQPMAQVNVVTADFFKTVRVPLVRGRDFDVHDDRNAPPVAIVTESFAREFFPGEDPVGKRITPNGSAEPGDPPVREIVGVVGDLHLISLGAAPKPQIYLPEEQFGLGMMSIFVRSQMSQSSLATTLRRAIDQIDKDVPFYRMRTLPEYLSQSIAQPRLNAMMVGLFAFIALLLAAAGIFGVMSYSVTQRTQEIGIRLALGAQRYDVLRLVIGQGMRFVGAGLLLGLIGVFACTRLLQSLLFGVGATDLPTLVAVSVILAAVAFAACLLPARKATLVDPIRALRAE